MPIAQCKAQIDARESLRYPTRIAGNIIIGHTTLPVTIDDLSDLGAHVTLADKLPVNIEVRLATSGLDVRASIVRRTAKGYGLRFHTVIKPLQVVRSNIWPSLV